MKIEPANFFPQTQNISTNTSFSDLLDTLRLELPNLKKNKLPELLDFQAKLNDYHLKVELCSKAAETITAVNRKLQQNS